MKKILLSLGLWLGLCAVASAQCIGASGAGGPNVAPGISCLSEPTIASYGATGVAIVAPATPTDVSCITGAAGTVVRVQRVVVSATITTQVVVPVLLTKHASANSGGTAGTTTQLPVSYKMDSSNATGAATLTSWTANPTINDSAPGIIASGLLVMTKADGTNGAVSPMTLFDFSEATYAQKPILRGIAQQLCVNLNGTAATMTGNLINISYYWTEAAQ